MSDNILEVLIYSIVESRAEDLEKARVANNSFVALLNYVRSLGKKTGNFNRVFSKQNEYLVGLSLDLKLTRDEHSKLSVFFMERGIFGVKSGLNAKAVRNWQSPTDSTTKDYIIYIYFNAPEEVKGNPKLYNQWFAENLDSILADDKMRSSYVHEFTHIMDYRRVDPSYLVKRTAAKNAEKQNMAAFRTDNDEEPKRDFGRYVNDPLELNAYFQQGLGDVIRQLKTAKTPEQKKDLIGSSAQEFVEKFMTNYLKKTFKKNLSPENQQRIMKRAAGIYDRLVDKYGI